MMAEISDKKNLFSMFKFLLEGTIEKESILESLKIAESTFYKHLNLIKSVGFKIKKNEENYDLITYKNLINFTSQELDAFIYLLLFAHTMLPSKKMKHYFNAIEKMLTLSNKQSACEVEEKYNAAKISAFAQCYSEKILKLKKQMELKKEINIILKDSKKIKIRPLKFEWLKEKLYLKYCDENEAASSILLDDIIKIDNIKKTFNLKGSQGVIFELYGKLSKSYLLKEDEEIIQHSKDKIVIANHSKDKNKLFRRLLRYDVYCKVIFPRADAVEFKKMIEKALANISKVSDNI